MTEYQSDTYYVYKYNILTTHIGTTIKLDAAIAQTPNLKYDNNPANCE